MTIEKAREILKDDESNMSDKQIQAIIDCFEKVIEVGFQQLEQKLVEGFDNEILFN